MPIPLVLPGLCKMSRKTGEAAASQAGAGAGASHSGTPTPHPWCSPEWLFLAEFQRCSKIQKKTLEGDAVPAGAQVKGPGRPED